MSIEITPLLSKKNNSKSDRIARTQEDLLYQLSKQYKFICRSLLEILKGHVNEIDRLSTAFRILFNNTRHSVSIFSQLDRTVKIFDTCKEIENGRRDGHPNPHQHHWEENETGGSRTRSEPEPLPEWDYS